MIDMALDSQQQIQTWPALTTSLGKTGIQKSNFLDASSDTNSFDLPFPANSGAFDDNYHEDFISLSFPMYSPPPPPPPKGYILEATARLNTLFNWAQTHQILSQYFFFYAYATLIISNEQVIMVLTNIELKVQQQ